MKTTLYQQKLAGYQNACWWLNKR